MRLRDQYDWIAVGETPGALLSAAIAAKQGFSVLIVPSSPGWESSTVKLANGEQVFDPEPNLWLGASNDKQKGLLHELLHKLGALDAEIQAFTPLGAPGEGAPGLELVTPQARVTLGGSAKHLSAEFKREGVTAPGLVPALRHAEDAILQHWARSITRLTLRKGGDVKAAHADPSLRAFLKGLEREHRRGDREARRWLARSAQGDAALGDRALIQGARTLWGAGDLQQGSPLHWIQQCALARTAATYKGGAAAWRAFLLRLAKRLGAEVAPKGEFKRIWVSRGRFEGIQLGSRSNVLPARGAALGLSVAELRKKIVLSGWGNYRRVRAPLAPRGWRFTLSLTVHAEAIPPRLSPRIVFQEKDAPPLEVEIANPIDFGVNDPEYRYVHVRTVLPFTAETLEPEYQRIMAGRMIRKLTELFPFLEYHVLHLYPDFRISASQREKLTLFGGVAAKAEGKEKRSEALPVEVLSELAQLYAFKKLEEIPANLLVYGDEGLGSASGIGHLFLVNEEAYPELGSLGPVWAALESMAWLAHKSGMNGPLSN